MPEKFIYDEAFKRNLGWITEDEAKILKNKHVAVAGLGGVGGSHVLTLVRLGIGKLTIADPDTFEMANFNRQMGAMMSTVGKAKVDAIAAMALDINPDLEIKRMKVAITDENVDEFLEGVDLYVDAVDFWAFDARSSIFKKCADKNIPATTAAPLGMGTAVLSFHPKKMAFEEYFGFKDADAECRTFRFLTGLAPRMLHTSYLVDRTKVKLKEQMGPSTPMSCLICSGAACTEALKILLNRGDVRYAPHGYQYDAYRNKLVKTWRPFGYLNPLQQLMVKIMKFIVRKAG